MLKQSFISYILLSDIAYVTVLSVPSLLGGPGFVSTSPAITSSRGITTTVALSSSITPPSTASLISEVVPRQWQCTLPPPPLPFCLDVKWTYCSISDRATTITQSFSTRGVSFMISPTPQLATPGWNSRPLLLHLVWRGRHMW